MYFQLLTGTHQGKGDKEGKGAKSYAVQLVRNSKGQIIKRYCPVIETDLDLLELFPTIGQPKFRELTKEEYDILKAKETSGEKKAKTPDVSEQKRKAVEDAAQQGAVDISAPLGADVTDKFGEADGASLKVFMKPGGKYMVMDGETGKFLTESSIKKTEVDGFIEKYLET